MGAIWTPRNKGLIKVLLSHRNEHLEGGTVLQGLVSSFVMKIPDSILCCCCEF